MFKILLVLAFSLVAWAGNLSIAKGEIKAHTEVFGDSEINPTTKNVKADLTMADSIESIKGKIYFETLSLISEKKDRDSNMYELLKAEKFKTISFDVKNIVKNENDYDITGVVSLNGVQKNISSKAVINKSNNQISMVGGFSFNLTDFGLEPPTMLFLTVRNQIDISYNISLNEVK